MTDARRTLVGGVAAGHSYFIPAADAPLETFNMTTDARIAALEREVAELKNAYVLPTETEAEAISLITRLQRRARELEAQLTLARAQVREQAANICKNLASGAESRRAAAYQDGADEAAKRAQHQVEAYNRAEDAIRAMPLEGEPPA